MFILCIFSFKLLSSLYICLNSINLNFRFSTGMSGFLKLQDLLPTWQYLPGSAPWRQWLVPCPRGALGARRHACLVLCRRQRPPRASDARRALHRQIRGYEKQIQTENKSRSCKRTNCLVVSRTWCCVKPRRAPNTSWWILRAKSSFQIIAGHRSTWGWRGREGVRARWPRRGEGGGAAPPGPPNPSRPSPSALPCTR